MLLAIDIGNTQTVLGVFDGDSLVETSRTETYANCAESDTLSRLLRRNDPAHLPIARIIIASVVPELDERWAHCCRETYGVEPLFVSADVPLPLELALPHPSTLGADRIANAVAAKILYGAPAIVVDFGTATNLDVLDLRGRFVGGPIAPGLEISAAALVERAAGIAAISFELPTEVVGHTTESALRAGLYYGEAAKADGLVARVREELNLPDDTCVLVTGGLATTLAPLMMTAAKVDPYLTLRGLCLLAALPGWW